jgi:hypothetical protein
MEQFLGFLFFIIIVGVGLFLPSIIELKKPTDIGPRYIEGVENSIILKKGKLEPVKHALSVNMSVIVFDYLTNIEV